MGALPCSLLEQCPAPQKTEDLCSKYPANTVEDTTSTSCDFLREESPESPSMSILAAPMIPSGSSIIQRLRFWTHGCPPRTPSRTTPSLSKWSRKTTEFTDSMLNSRT